MVLDARALFTARTEGQKPRNSKTSRTTTFHFLLALHKTGRLIIHTVHSNCATKLVVLLK